LTQGETEQDIINMAVRQGKPLPDVIANAPELHDGQRFWYNAFLDLSTDRPVGFGEGPIPWSSIECYADAFRLRDLDREDLHFHVRSLDKAYLKFKADKASSKTTDQVQSPPMSRRGKKG